MANLGNVTIKVTPQELVDKSVEVKGYIDRMTQHFAMLKTLVNKTKSYWQGEGAEVHRKMYEELEPHIDLILKRLGEHPIDLIEIAKNYSDVELKIQNIIETLPGDVIV